MIISNVSQAYIIAMTFISGVFAGIFFDIYRVIRGIKVPNKIMTFISDLLFWILAGFMVYIFLHIVGAPFISVYAYLCIALGFGLYYKMISRHFTKILSVLVNSAVKSLRMIFNYLIYPFQLIIKGKNKN
ncbi:spore cortex biosynthesis protein YabQ [Clostridium bornimense]|uniref:spore cortex biosynthesis protein YabQ n=1 Tax=Clostridium bornimense TaxID=1216932 RepID=UPI001C111BE0|nr:spore cortex biosynthesis protein YabQ [Clostridium bornimense]MBU5315612.1 spore cortex biosynthesis protein YabQ [Clostridium bornimense]